MTTSPSTHHEESLPLRGLHALAPWTWRGLVLLVLLLAAYLLAGRLLVAQLGVLRAPLLDALNARLPFVLATETLRGDWVGFSPELRFETLEVRTRDGSGPPLRLAGGLLRLDVPASLRTRSLQLSRLEVRGLSLAARLTEQGSIELEGFGSGGGRVLRAWLEIFLPNVEGLSLRDSRLRLTAGEQVFDLSLDLGLEREGSTRHLQGRLAGTGLSLALDATGVGSPLRPASWTGDVFADLRSDDLSVLGELWRRFDLPFTIDGGASTQFWLTRADGASQASLRMASEDLRLREPGGAWSLPLDALSFEAALSQRARHWSLLTKDFHLERSGETVNLERAQFDWWGQALRVRLTALELDELPALLGAAPGIPEGLRAALPELAPRGLVDALELRLDDLTRPAETWRLRAGLAGVAIGSWRGTPAVEGVAGFLDLAASGGRLQLDSRNLSLFFPRVYREPLSWDDAAGELRLAWDDEALRVGSGLLRVAGEEGVGHGLFSLEIPFAARPTGVELGLLVGLSGSRAAFRSRYLPYRLPEPLLAWLDESILRADVPAAGFLWRGSTRREARAHRTVQLHLAARDADVAFDPAWPVVEGASGAVLVDDGRTFVRVDRARSLNLALEDLVVRVLPRETRPRLDVAAGISGAAADGARLLTDSPLAAVTGGIFGDWDFSGMVSGDFAVSLELGDGAGPPWVDLNLGLEDIDAHMAQLGLPIEAASGELRYNSERGFRGSHARAKLLGGEVAVEARPTPRPGLDLALDARIDSAAVGAWLGDGVPPFVAGMADVTGNLRVDGDQGARLALASELTDVTLDAPPPFAKAPGQALPLKLQVPLEPSPQLSLDLGERLHLSFIFDGAQPAHITAVLGADAPDAGDCPQFFCLRGELSTLDLSAWRDFAAAHAPAGASAGDAGEFSYAVQQFSIGELALGDRSLGPARVDLRGVGAAWGGRVEAPWLTASLTRPGGRLALDIEDLDISGFGGGDPVDLAALVDTLPAVRVDVQRLRSGDRELGQLGFDLMPRRDERALYAVDLTGRLWGARLAEPDSGLLRWSATDGGETTAIEIDAGFDDLGAVVAAAGYVPSIESSSGRASVRLAWPGAPTAFDAKTARGTLSVSAREGRILEERPGPLALIGFLNFAEILRGLSLSHMFETGIPFERATTRLSLGDGVVDISELEIDGAASAFSFSGRSNLAAGEVDGELVVTLPVANNLPWVAALAGGLPVAAGVFVVSKVFEKQVNRMSSAVYGISGAIDAPEVEFRRLFDDQFTPSPEAPEDSGTGGG